MDNSYLLQLLNGLSISRLKEFDRFMASPYFNTGKTTLLLYKEIRKSFPLQKNSALPGKAELFSAVYPGRKYDDVLFRRLISNIHALYGEFIYISSAKENRAAKYAAVMETANKTNSYSGFAKAHAAFELELKSRQVDMDHLKDKASMHRLLLNYEMNHNNFEKVSLELNSYSSYITCYFLQVLTDIYKTDLVLRSSYKSHSSKRILDAFFTSFDFKKFAAAASEEKVIDYPAVNEFYLTWRLLRDPDDFEAYTLLKEIVFSSITRYSTPYAGRVLNVLLNFGLNRIIQKNDSSYYGELFSLYRLALSNNNLLSVDNRNMSLVTYRNILFVAMEAGEYKWTEEFIKKHIALVKDDNKASLQHISEAIIFFSQGDFEASLREISAITYDHPVFRLDVKNMTLRIYYELSHFESARSMLDSFDHLLKGERTVSRDVIKMHSAFLKFYRLLLRIKESAAREDAALLKKKLAKETGLLNRDWFYDKLDELK